VMLFFTPRGPHERLETVAQAVVEATPDPMEQALLLTVSLYETGFGRAGIPFGISSVNRRNHTSLLDDARASLRILRRSRAMCGSRPSEILGHYHHGNGCHPDGYSLREAQTVERMVRQYNRRVALSRPRIPVISVRLARNESRR
jgi:hypothetical protein